MLIWILASGLVAQNQRRPWRSSTRPPESNDRGLRELTDEEIPPNLNFYAMDPLYNPDVVLGWAEERIEEKLDRGLLALSMEGGKVYLSWRMLKTDPANIAFNIYRSIANGDAIKLNTGPIKATTDFIDTNPPLERENAWFIKPVLDGREQAVSKRAELPANPPAQQYKSIKLKDDVRGVSIVGRIGPNRGTYKYDGYDGRTMSGTAAGSIWVTSIRTARGWNVLAEDISIRLAARNWTARSRPRISSSGGMPIFCGRSAVEEEFINGRVEC